MPLILPFNNYKNKINVDRPSCCWAFEQVLCWLHHIQPWITWTKKGDLRVCQQWGIPVWWLCKKPYVSAQTWDISDQAHRYGQLDCWVNRTSRGWGQSQIRIIYLQLWLPWLHWKRGSDQGRFDSPRSGLLLQGRQILARETPYHPQQSSLWRRST